MAARTSSNLMKCANLREFGIKMFNSILHPTPPPPPAPVSRSINTSGEKAISNLY